MNKILFRTAAAAVALASFAGTAQAGDQINNVTFSANPNSDVLGLVGYLLGNGSVYSEDSDGFLNNTETRELTVTNTFLLKGNVTKDCSYYGGGTNAHTIDFGQIGVRTGNGENVSGAFEMRDGTTLDIESATAGCNFNNKVTIAKNAQGLRNTSAGGYDTREFQANIPYSVRASLSATTNLAAGAVGGNQNFTVEANDDTESRDYGAWRSSLDMRVTIPRVDKGLVAGDYSDTITLTLAAQ